MSNGKFNLIVVAHPDDETIFFGGLVLSSLRKSKTKWKIICTTDGNADGQGQKRKKQFEKACKMLGVSDTEWLAFPDIYEKRIPVDALAECLKELRPQEIYTHGIIGEYGHPHHQDVSFAVHSAFADRKKVFSVAYNSFPEKSVQLTQEDFEVKAKILTRVYGSETSRFLNLLPVTSTESFQRLSIKEVAALYSFFAHGKDLRTRDLTVHSWLVDYLRLNRERARPF